tara:strand:- start:53 stop:229 length:177 start_codon:yes stop_codon:yes gene_type:complete
MSNFSFLNIVYGYIDPSLYAAFIAMIISVFAGVGITLKLYWFKLKYKLLPTRKFDKDD